MKKVYLLPNIVTAFGLTCGLFVIFKMNMIGSGDVTADVLIVTTGILILAAFADLLDGAIARVMKAESAFGTLFDSLSDAITFGVAPSVIILKTLSIMPGTDLSFFMTGAAMLYTVSGVLRLTRYNVMHDINKANEEQALAGSRNFTGLPIPAAAGAAISLNLLLASAPFSFLKEWTMMTRTWVLFAGLILLGYFMISRWRFPSLKALHIRVASFQMVFVIVVIAVFIFYGILNHFPLLFFLGCWGYLIVSFLLSLVRITTGKKSKTLEDFEPEPESDDDPDL